jgi:hypothetical protein
MRSFLTMSVSSPEANPLRALTISALALLLAPIAARADRGALTVDAGAGASVLRVVAPYADSTASQIGSAPAIWIDGRYGLTNSIELTTTIFAETSVPFYVPGTTITSDAGKLSGTLEMRARRYGVMAGARLLHGNIWRLIVGGDVGWALSSYSSMRLIDESNPSGPRDFGLALPDTTASSLVLAPSAGISWVGNKLSITVLPRFEALLGSTRSWAITVPLTIGWDWYL